MFYKRHHKEGNFHLNCTFQKDIKININSYGILFFQKMDYKKNIFLG